MPWASYKLDDRGLVMRDENNIPILTGYCVEVQLKVSNYLYIFGRNAGFNVLVDINIKYNSK